MIIPYIFNAQKYGLSDSDNLLLNFYTSQKKEIILIDEVYGAVFKYFDGQFVEFSTECYLENNDNSKPTTRKELRDAGLWEFVVNKEDFSSLEDQLEEYQRIGEEIEKTKS